MAQLVIEADQTIGLYKCIDYIVACTWCLPHQQVQKAKRVHKRYQGPSNRVKKTVARYLPSSLRRIQKAPAFGCDLRRRRIATDHRGVVTACPVLTPRRGGTPARQGWHRHLPFRPTIISAHFADHWNDSALAHGNNVTSHKISG